MTKYQIPLTMFNTETITTKVVLDKCDFKLMISMFENKIISRDQINREFFHDVSINTVNRRLRKLVGLGLITRMSLIVSGRVICGYCLSRRGFTKIKPLLPYKVNTKAILSDCPFFMGASTRQTCAEFKSDRQFRPFIELNSDAMAEVAQKLAC